MGKAKNIVGSGLILASALLALGSCERFLNPEQELAITEDRLYTDWYEYRAIEMGLYGLQQQLVEQLFILGELRGDLLEVTNRADADMLEVYNFQISPGNRYASPTGFLRLIAACNSFIRTLEHNHPEVLDPGEPVNNYDRLYGEALAMRAWTYFNAGRIFGKVPYIPESLTSLEEVEAFVESPGTYIDSVHIDFGRDGYDNDTTEIVPIELEKNLWDLELIIDHFTAELEQDIKAIGVIHYIDNADNTWEVTIWGQFSLHALLGHMYLTQGDLTRAKQHFSRLVYYNSEDLRYRLDGTFANDQWQNIFTGIDVREHIYTIWFNKSYFQQNQMQSFLELWDPHDYKLKPTYQAILKWESVWRNQFINYDNQNPMNSEVVFPGFPSDFFRGFGYSYLYVRNGLELPTQDYVDMLLLRAQEDDRNSQAIMENVDTIVFKYSIGKGLFDQDANYHLYRAAGIHLYMAELMTYHAFDQNGLIRPDIITGLEILNNGRQYDNRTDERGVRGRVGLGGNNDMVRVSDIEFIHDPFTNEIIDYIDLRGSLLRKQEILEEKILDERARELAFEGERFYDLMRVAKRRNDPGFLARTVAAKFPPGQREAIEAHLMDEANWYIPAFE